MPKSITSSYVKITHIIALVIAVSMFTTSCTNSKKLVILNDIPDTARVALPFIETPVNTIQPDDILEIKISGKNPETSNDFNSKGGGYYLNTGASSTAVPNYLVDKNGFIEIYKLGKIKAAGLTKDQLKENLQSALEKELVEPTVVVRFVNMRFTVLGEVRTPSTYTIPNEKLTILEAVGYAGDLTMYAKRNSIRVIRDSSGHREIGSINLNQKSLFTSPFYYIKRNDVILIESDYTSKKQTEVFAKTASIIGILSGLITVVYLILRK
ncbi:MAG TPA: polysaccharide biosynthesis/export family protein [Chitinophagaceae bacterium]|nr:polysaccharide biosynthesis/export family protein [Chitinophagaceae bacterium]